MTSSTGKPLDGKGASASAHDDTHDAAGSASILAMIAQRALDRDGKLIGPSALLNALRSSDERRELLRKFTIGIQPEGVNPALWERWLQGGASPFERAVKLETPAPKSMGVSRAAERQDRIAQRARIALTKATRAAEAAQAKVVEAEKALQIAGAKDAAFIEYLVSEHLMSIMQPIQLMGPAWTVVRSLSGFVEPDAMKKELIGVREAKHAEMEVFVRSERMNATQEMLMALDLWCGDLEFETALRDSIAAVVERFSKRERAGEAPRSLKAMATSVRTKESRQQRRQIVSGMAPPKP